MYGLHQVRLKLPCPRGRRAEGRIPIPFQGVEEECYTLPLEPSLPPPSRLHLCLSCIDLAGFEELTRLHPSSGSRFPVLPRARSLGDWGRCHFRNQKRSSINIDFSFFFFQLLSSLGTCVQLAAQCNQRECWPCFSECPEQCLTFPPNSRKNRCMHEWKNEWVNEQLSASSLMLVFQVASSVFGEDKHNRWAGSLT